MVSKITEICGIATLSTILVLGIINIQSAKAQQTNTGNFVEQELAEFKKKANTINATIASATFTPGSGKVTELINSVLVLRGGVSQLGAGFSILHSVEDASVNKIKQAGPSAFSASEQAYITSWLDDAMSKRQEEQSASSKLLPGFQS